MKSYPKLEFLLKGIAVASKYQWLTIKQEVAPTLLYIIYSAPDLTPLTSVLARKHLYDNIHSVSKLLLLNNEVLLWAGWVAIQLRTAEKRLKAFLWGCGCVAKVNDSPWNKGSM